MSCGRGPGAEGAGLEGMDEHADCSEVLHRVYEYLDGEMTAGDTHKIAQHLDECGPCSEAVRPGPGAQGAGQAVVPVRGGARAAARADHDPHHDDSPEIQD